MESTVGDLAFEKLRPRKLLEIRENKFTSSKK